MGTLGNLGYNVPAKFETIPSWWFQPLWKILVKMGSPSPIFGVKMKNNWNRHPGNHAYILRIYIVDANGRERFYLELYQLVTGGGPYQHVACSP